MKKAKINGLSINVFEELELKEKLGLKENEIDIVIKYQKQFPELLQEKQGFCIDTRKLHNQLKIGTEYAKWIKRRIEKYGFKENEDYTTIVKFDERENSNLKSKSIEFLTTLNMAKELSMVENNDVSREVRKYFIIIEDTLRNYETWNVGREIEKDGWNTMKQNIQDWCKRKGFDSTIKSFYTREANLINQALFGKDAIEINWILKNDDKLTRNHLNISMNNAITEMQDFNSNLLLSDMSFEQRELMIKTICKTKYRNLKQDLLKIVA